MSRKHIFPKATYAHPNLRQQRAQLQPKKLVEVLLGSLSIAYAPVSLIFLKTFLHCS